jgi:hypothetical protein
MGCPGIDLRGFGMRHFKLSQHYQGKKHKAEDEFFATIILLGVLEALNVITLIHLTIHH